MALAATVNTHHGLSMRKTGRIQNRLVKQRPYLLGCLEPVGAERALRPAVIARKISCGNKTARRAKTFERLASLRATWWQRGKSIVNKFTQRAGIRR